MRVLKTIVLASVVAAFASPALAGGGAKSAAGGCGWGQSLTTAQTVVTPTGPQTVVTQSAENTK